MIVEKDSLFHSLCHTVIISPCFVVHEHACILAFLPKILFAKSFASLYMLLRLGSRKTVKWS
jgi:hypothetical protein